MPLTIVEVIQLVAKGYIGALAVIGTDDVIDVFQDMVGDPLYGNAETPDTPMDQPTFYRAYQHRQFDLLGEIPVGPVAAAVDDDEEEAEPEADADDADIDPNDFNTWPDEDLADYLVEEAGEERRNWKRSTMIKKITRYAETGSAD